MVRRVLRFEDVFAGERVRRGKVVVLGKGRRVRGREGIVRARDWSGRLA